jgi:hypothetical protein
MPTVNCGVGNTNVSIPENAYSIVVELAGGSGGQGGTDAGASPRPGGGGRKAVFYFPQFVARTLTISVGSQGGNGFGCVGGGGRGASGFGGPAVGGIGGATGPSGCSGGGGGGGGCSAIYDSVKNGYVACVGGGGGGGGASWNASATDSGNGTYARGMYSGNINSISGGGVGASCPNDGGGGGGGGAGAPGRPGGYEGYDNNRGGQSGDGGYSAFDSSYCSFTSNTGTQNFGNGFGVVTYLLADPSIDSFSASPTAFKRGECTTLSWATTFAQSASIDNGVGNVSVDGSTTVCPTNTTTYTLTASGYGITKTAPVTVTVYVPPIFNISTNKTEMMLGDSAQISWSVSGDGGALNWSPALEWLAGGLTNLNVTSFSNVSPTDTTIYTGRVYGVGGEDTGSTSVTVYQPVELSVDYPDELFYSFQGNIEVTTKYATVSVTVTPTYNYDFVGSTTGAAVNLDTNTSAVLGATDNTDTYTTTIPYTDRGPLSVSYVVRAEGPLGNFKEESFTVPINIDKTPDNLYIEETDQLIKDQEPVFTPEVEVLSDLLLIDDIDIQVEIKANQPIQVDINQSGDWEEVREL